MKNLPINFEKLYEKLNDYFAGIGYAGALDRDELKTYLKKEYGDEMFEDNFYDNVVFYDTAETFENKWNEEECKFMIEEEKRMIDEFINIIPNIIKKSELQFTIIDEAEECYCCDCNKLFELLDLKYGIHLDWIKDELEEKNFLIIQNDEKAIIYLKNINKRRIKDDNSRKI